MSWEIFKQTILRVANNPESISDRNTVAKLYAKAYDDAIKTGGDTNNKTRLIEGNVELMRQGFLAALEKGVTTHGPYDLVAQMGDGVKAYWTNATMDKYPVPTDLPEGAVANINIAENKITDVGNWLKPLSTPSTPKPVNTLPTVPKQNLKPSDDYNLRKMLDDAGYAAIKKYEDDDGCVSLISGKTGLQLTDYKKIGCGGYKPGQDAQEGIIKERVKNVLGFDVWAKIPPIFRMQIYSFMYNADSSPDTGTGSGDKFRWIAGLLQAAKNETSQYRASVRTNQIIRDFEIPYLKTLTTVDFQKMYPNFLKVLDEMYQAISNAELQSAVTKTKNSEKASATRLASAYNLTWKDRPFKIQTYYESTIFAKKDKSPQEAEQKVEPSKQTTEEPTSDIPLKSGPIQPTNNTALIVDYFIKTAIDHLDTIKGIIITQSNYGVINGAGKINWTGYLVKGTSKKIEIFIADDFSDKLSEFLKAEGIVETEEIVDENSDEKGGDAVTYTKYKGGSKQQKNAMANALLNVHKIGTYTDYKDWKQPKGKNNFSVGFDVGLCAQWTFNIAKNYVFYLNGFGSKSDGPAYRAGANANEFGYWASLKFLGYRLDIDTTFESKAPLVAVLSDAEKFNIGDVAVYFGTDGIELPGHTQIFTGGYGSDYPKAGYGTAAPKRPNKKYLEKGGWDTVSNWETDAYNNYGSSMVYRSKSSSSKTWRLLIFRAPSK
jgi:hypothetical protein